jgi:hypothetical protein
MAAAQTKMRAPLKSFRAITALVRINSPIISLFTRVSRRKRTTKTRSGSSTLTPSGEGDGRSSSPLLSYTPAVLPPSIWLLAWILKVPQAFGISSTSI